MKSKLSQYKTEILKYSVWYQRMCKQLERYKLSKFQIPLLINLVYIIIILITVDMKTGDFI